MASARPVSRSVVRTGIVALVGIAILCGLGFWQVARLAWKERLIATASERAALPATPLPGEEDWGALTYDADEYRKVTVGGRFRHDLEAQVFTSLDDTRFALSGPGYWVMTPLELPGGATVIVNRGFVPHSRRLPVTRADGQVAGEVVVTGLIRMPEHAGWFLPANDPGAGEWFVRDPAAIAAAAGLARTAPFFIDADAAPNPGGLPLGGTTRISFRNAHLGYALTWFGLALALAGVYAAWAVSQVRRPDELARGAPRQ